MTGKVSSFMNKYIIFIILFITTLSVIADDQQWEFKIELSKQNYLLNENIWLDVTITNITPDTLKSACIINSRGCGFKYIVKDSLGNNIDYTGPYTGARYNPEAYLIEPGEQIYRCFNLRYLYYSIRENSGRYTIRGIIDLPFENECYFDNPTSNELSFNIVEPSGEEKEASELITKARELSSSRDSSEQYYQELLDNYPNSVYAEESFRHVLRKETVYNYDIKDEQFDYIKYANMSLFRYPNSGDSNSRLGWILHKMKDYDQEIINRMLNNIIKVAPDTRLSGFAKQALFRENRVKLLEECESIVDEEQNWDLIIGLSKQKYFLHEDIIVDVTITNITNDTLKSDCIIIPDNFGFNFIIKDSLGNILEYAGPQYSYGISNKTHLIGPGEQVYVFYDLLGLYKLDSPGKYTIQAENIINYYNPYFFDNLTSNELSFETIELIGDEKEVYDLMREARKLWRKKDSDQAGRKYQEILNKYPNTVFFDECYRNARAYTNNVISNYFNGSPVDRIGYLKDLIDKSPDSENVRGWILGLERELENEDILEYLKKVIKDYPNTRAAKIVRQKLVRDSRKQVPK